jgi:hypothetical protein
MSDEAVAATRQSLNQAGIVRRISQCFAHAVHGGVESVLEVAKRLGRPELLLQLFASDEFSGAKQQRFENLKRLPGQTDSDALFAEFPSTQVDLEDAKADDSRGVS